jgi:hypothetical protein
MSRYFVFLLGAILIAGTALADPVVGPTPPGGWGTDCSEWIVYSDPWNSGEMIYDPVLGSGGEGWRVCATATQVVWPSLDIELWIEMECILTWEATHVQVHLASAYDDFYLYFNGTSACNNGQYIITTPPTALGSLGFLPFVEDMFGRTGPTYGTDIPLVWEYSLNGGSWLPMEDLSDPPGSKYFLVDACDHYFTIRVLVDMVYHQEDGYYYLGGPGSSICPAVPL